MSAYYILRVADIFGDSHPLASVTSGLDGIAHPTLADAKTAAKRFQSDAAWRRQLLDSNGMTLSTLRRVEIHRVTH